MSGLVRVFVVILAYGLACIAASIILTIGTLTPEWDDLTAAGFQSGAMWVVIFISAAVIAAIVGLAVGHPGTWAVNWMKPEPMHSVEILDAPVANPDLRIEIKCLP